MNLHESMESLVFLVFETELYDYLFYIILGGELNAGTLFNAERTFSFSIYTMNMHLRV